MNDLHADAELIESLGGPAALARELGYTEKGSVQRIQNWKYRGIPELVWRRRVDLFGVFPEERVTAKAA